MYKDIFKGNIFEVCYFFKDKIIDYGSAQKQKMMDLPKPLLSFEIKPKGKDMKEVV